MESQISSAGVLHEGYKPTKILQNVKVHQNGTKSLVQKPPLTKSAPNRLGKAHICTRIPLKYRERERRPPVIYKKHTFQKGTRHKTLMQVWVESTHKKKKKVEKTGKKHTKIPRVFFSILCQQPKNRTHSRAHNL